MRLVTYTENRDLPEHTTAVGVLVGDRVVEVDALLAASPAGSSERRFRSIDDVLDADAIDRIAAAAAWFHQHGHFTVPTTPQTDISLLAPITHPSKVIGVGMNYRSFITQIGAPPPLQPHLFHKTAAALNAHLAPIAIPDNTRQAVPEGELAVIIGRTAWRVGVTDADQYIAGYTCANDISAKDLEFQTSQWTSGKMLPTFGPLGPALVTPDEIGDPDDLEIRTILNGQVVQLGHTSDMTFGVRELVSRISWLVRLEPGDVILTGTPSDLGEVDPPVFLTHGDTIQVFIDGVGELENTVIAPHLSPRSDGAAQASERVQHPDPLALGSSRTDDVVAITSVDTERDSMSLTWDDGSASRFHHLWLRDNCACLKCGPHDSGSRLQKFLDIPEDVAPESVSILGTTLRIVWAGDHHESTFPARWLRSRAYSPPMLRLSREPRKTLWDSSLVEMPTVDWQRVLVDDVERLRLHAAVYEFGFVVVTNAGTDHDLIERLAAEVGYVRETHYGRVFDLITRRDPTILADLGGSILPHTDETYRAVPTGINIFHCIQPSGDGGGISTLVDSHHVAEVLRRTEPEVFDLLTTLPIRHERRVTDQTIVSELPAFTLDHRGDIVEVRLNERTMSALCVEEDQMLAAYRALRTVFTLAYDPANRIVHPLAAGEALLFDNLRVLHGRTGYNGDRFLRQTGVMRDEFFGKLASLSERVGAHHDGLVARLG